MEWRQAVPLSSDRPGARRRFDGYWSWRVALLPLVGQLGYESD
jgi:hypothetical protein